MQRLGTSEATARSAGDRRGTPLARLLIEDGAIGAQPLVGALAEAGRVNRPVARIVSAEGLVSPEDLLKAQADHYGALVLRKAASPTDPAALARLPAAFCLTHGAIPWRFVGTTLVIATARPEDFEALRDTLPQDIGPVMMALTTEQDVHDIIAEHHGAALAAAAETTRAADESCRDLAVASPRAMAAAGLAAVLVIALVVFAPNLLFAAALGLALLSLVVAQALKAAALLTRPFAKPDTPIALGARPPRFTLLVPLFREQEIAGALINRLTRLQYPRSLTEIILILEEDDAQTEAALARTRLPSWFRVVSVPPGTVKTKPRALNYALNFATGDIIGVYDAEDAPAPDQLDRVAARFQAGPEKLGCIQGILDFYNPRANWLSRCFAIEYASWFRVVLPGLARLGFAVPLGGTTLFLRRAVLESTGGWDAHNVTEDADLGILLARRGYRTELLATVTREEANNRLWPWVRQRSRWLKGYALTWWVHARRPGRLVRDLGMGGALGVHALFLSTVVSLLLAPVLWSFWLIVFGLPHPLDGMLGGGARTGLITLFLAAEAITILAGLTAVARSPHGGLLPWVPSMVAYFPLGTIALYKALWEVLRRPFYWDKTEHGRSAPDGPGADTPEG